MQKNTMAVQGFVFDECLSSVKLELYVILEHQIFSPLFVSPFPYGLLDERRHGGVSKCMFILGVRP